jgi:streptogramin lyase
LVAITLFSLAAAALANNGNGFTEYRQNTMPGRMVAGSDGALWVLTQQLALQRTDTRGWTTSIPLQWTFRDMAAGADGNLWLLEWGASNKVVRLTPEGTSLEIVISSDAISIGRDALGGAVWIGSFGKLVRVASDGTTNDVPFQTPLSLTDEADSVTPTVDGSVWFTRGRGNSIYVYTPDHRYVEIGVGANNLIGHLAAAPDGSVWVETTHGLLHFTTAGLRASFPFTVNPPLAMTVANDGTVWFTNLDGIVHFENGVFLPYLRPGFFIYPGVPGTSLMPGAARYGCAMGSDGRFWFSEYIIIAPKMGLAPSLAPNGPGELVAFDPSSAVAALPALGTIAVILLSLGLSLVGLLRMR